MPDKKLTMREVMLADCYEREIDQLRELLGEAKEIMKNIDEAFSWYLHDEYEIGCGDYKALTRVKEFLVKIETALEKEGEDHESQEN